MKKDHSLEVYNTLSRKKEKFEPLEPPFVGMYVCGPTVWGYSHLGHAKSYVSFDVIYRYLKYLEYKIRYVQNITDVGHLTDDADEGEDKISRQSKIERVEPMELVEHYMGSYYHDMDSLNILRPSIAPRPSCHIPEQIEVIEKLIEKGFAYEVKGSVYFDVNKYNKDNHYGILSGRKTDELLEAGAARTLSGQSEKRNPMDFALWKKAAKEHLMQWNSPWGKGYPGWHIECSVMSQKYLGDTFDIHGGGMENMFPHHECEIAQAKATTGKPFAKYWLHNNMVTVNGQKMGKSLGNSISCQQLFTADHELLDQAYSPMTVRFFILQSHYRSTLDFSNDALKAAGKGLERLLNLQKELNSLAESDSNDFDFDDWKAQCQKFMDNDFNTPRLIAHLFDTSKVVHNAKIGKININKKTKFNLIETFKSFTNDILGIKDENNSSDKNDKNAEVLKNLMEIVLEMRAQAKEKKDFATADYIRKKLTDSGIKVKDTKEGVEWTI